jgi:hypothetical protein
MMAKIDTIFLDKTIAFWQARGSYDLNRESARQIIENLTGFCRVLSEWDSPAQPPSTDSNPKTRSAPKSNSG